MPEFILNNIEDGIRTISINRPEKLNAIHRGLTAELDAAFREANRDPVTRVIVFRGEGRAFCAGYDLTSHSNEGAMEVRVGVDQIQSITRELVLGNKVVIGAIHGWAVGAGMEWAINCDLALWGESARGFFPELEWGLFVTGGVTAILPKMVGLASTKELILLREKQSAQRLHELGLAWRVVADDQVHDEAYAIAKNIAALPQKAVVDFKRVINRAAYGDVENAMAMETEVAIRGTTDAESAERIKEFG